MNYVLNFFKNYLFKLECTFYDFVCVHFLDMPSLPRYARVNTIATSVSAVLEDLRNNGIQQVQYDKNTSLEGYVRY